MTRDEIFCANAGDSRSVLSVGGKAIELSKDHKPDDTEESKRIYNAGSFVEEGRVNGMLALSRAFGDFEYKNNNVRQAKDQAVSAFPDIKVEPIQDKTEFIFLACDGIWDVMTSQEVVTFCHQHIYKNNYGNTPMTLQKLEVGMGAIMDECCATDLASSQGLGCDNMTAIIVDINTKNK